MNDMEGAMTAPDDQGRTVYEDEGVRLWQSSGSDDDGVAILSFKSKGHTLGPEVLEGIIAAVTHAEANYKGMVIWQPKAPFSFGANLKAMAAMVQAGAFEQADQYIARFQQMTATLKYARVPVVAGVYGMALGGGCEVVMHCARAVAAQESSIGLVEAGVGLLPAGGGCKEFALRAAQVAEESDSWACIEAAFTTIFSATASRDAQQAREKGFLRTTDLIVPDVAAVLPTARQTALALSAGGYTPPSPARDIRVAGRDGIARLEATLAARREAGEISAHDVRVGRAIAAALCGGDVDTGARVNEDWLLTVERRAFAELLKTEETQQRIAHTMATGKPLRN